jgi:hypothetical protein
MIFLRVISYFAKSDVSYVGLLSTSCMPLNGGQACPFARMIFLLCINKVKYCSDKHFVNSKCVLCYKYE